MNYYKIYITLDQEIEWIIRRIPKAPSMPCPSPSPFPQGSTLTGFVTLWLPLLVFELDGIVNVFFCV